MRKRWVTVSYSDRGEPIAAHFFWTRRAARKFAYARNRWTVKRSRDLEKSFYGY